MRQICSSDFSPSFWTVQISEELDGGGQLCRIMFSCVVLGFHFLLLVAFIEPAADVSAEDELGCSRSSVTEEHDERHRRVARDAASVHDGGSCAVIRMATDVEVTKWVTWDSYTSAEDALNFLRNVAIPHPWLKAICVDGNPAGSIVAERGTGFSSCRATMGYCLAKRYWGMGVATVAVNKMVSMAFQGMDIARVEALVEHSNVASRRVLEKTGFHLEGTMYKYLLVKGKLLDCFLFAIYAPKNTPTTS